MILLSPLVLLTLPFFMVSDTPLVSHDQQLQQSELDRARELYRQYNPSRLPRDRATTVSLDATSINLLARYLLTSIPADWLSSGMHSAIESDRLLIKSSLASPYLPENLFFNLQFALSKQDGRLKLSDLRLGELQVADSIANYFPGLLDGFLSNFSEWHLLRQSLLDFRIDNNHVELDLRLLSSLERQAREKIRGYLQSPLTADYARQLLALPSNQLDFDSVIRQLFAHARQRSQNGDAVAENRAVLMLLGNWALGLRHQAGLYLPPFRLTLQGRKDLAQHLLISAAISAHAGSALSNLLGTGKEYDDADGGSGFSLDDLLADRLGTRIGRYATASRASAIALQQAFSDPRNVASFYPAFKPAHGPLTQAQFRQRYGSVNDSRYQEMLSQLDRLIADSPLFKN